MKKDNLVAGLAGLRIREEDKRAENTGIRGAEIIADSISGLQQSSQVVMNQYSNELSGNPLFWDLRDSDRNGKYIVFSKDVGRSLEIFVMKNDGSDIRRLTFNDVMDEMPRFVKGNGIMWKSGNTGRKVLVTSIMYHDLDSHTTSLVETRGLSAPEYRHLCEDIFENGYSNFAHLIKN